MRVMERQHDYEYDEVYGATARLEYDEVYGATARLEDNEGYGAAGQATSMIRVIRSNRTTMRMRRIIERQDQHEDYMGYKE